MAGWFKFYNDLIFDTRELTDREFRMLIFFMSVSYEKDGIRIIRGNYSYKKIASILSKSYDWVKRGVEGLEEKGILEVLRKSGTANIYTIGNIGPRAKMPRGKFAPGQKCPHPQGKFALTPRAKMPSPQGKFALGHTLLYKLQEHIRTHTTQEEDVCVCCGVKGNPEKCLKNHVKNEIENQNLIADHILYKISDEIGDINFMMNAPGAFEAYRNGKIKSTGGVIKAIREGWYRKEISGKEKTEENEKSPIISQCSDITWMKMKREYEPMGAIFCKNRRRILGLRYKGKDVITVVSSGDYEYVLLDNDNTFPVNEAFSKIEVFIPDDLYIKSNPCCGEKCFDISTESAL